MKNINSEALRWLEVILIALIWIALLFFAEPSTAIGLRALKVLPEVVTIFTVLSVIFTKWAWRWPIFHGWLVPFPDLQGTWRGTVQSTWIDPATGSKPAPIEAMLVITQTFSSVSCTVYTAESESHSNAAQFIEDEASKILRLSYTYANRPKLSARERSEIHDGAALLTVDAEEKILEGEYWTNRKTVGEMHFTLSSRKHSRRFTESSPATSHA